MNYNLKHTFLAHKGNKNSIPELHKYLIILKADNITYLPATDQICIDTGCELRSDPKEAVNIMIQPSQSLINSNYTLISPSHIFYTEPTRLYLYLRHRDSLYSRAMCAAQLRYDHLSFLNKFKTSVSDIFEHILSDYNQYPLRDLPLKSGDPICTLSFNKQLIPSSRCLSQN